MSFSVSADYHVTGWPPPKVSWWRGGTLIDDTAESLNGRRVKNTLLLESITRQHLGSSLLCQAANSPLMSPLTATLVIDIYRKSHAINVL